MKNRLEEGMWVYSRDIEEVEQKIFVEKFGLGVERGKEVSAMKLCVWRGSWMQGDGVH